MNIRDPRYPPNMIVSGDLVIKGLYICIPENINNAKIDDNTKDVALLTAEMGIRLITRIDMYQILSN